MQVHTYRRKRKERNRKHTKARGHNFAHPRLRHGVTVTDCRHSDNAPPQRIRVACEIRFAIGPHHVLFGQIHKVRAEYQPQKAYVQRRY